jgi:hypothetical protein
LTAEPEISFARRLAARLGLKPPVDIARLVQRYANLKEAKFPVDVDGICLDLKTPGKRPRVIVNSNRSENRMRFTLAHELGHIIIPWHTGCIIDETEIDGSGGYWEMEKEANRFASELLMPEAWVRELFEEASDTLNVLECVMREGVVSAQAATIRLMNVLPAGHIVAHVNRGVVVTAARSPGTLANPPPVGGSAEIESVFPWAEYKQRTIESRHYVCWTFSSDTPMPGRQTAREWRDILDEIVGDLFVPDQKQFKATVNGIVAGANSSMRNNRKSGAIYSACLQRLHSRAAHDVCIAKFVNHALFEEFIRARVEAFLQ